jgi:hypothetical protein
MRFMRRLLEDDVLGEFESLVQKTSEESKQFFPLWLGKLLPLGDQWWLNRRGATCLGSEGDMVRFLVVADADGTSWLLPTGPTDKS